MSNDRNASGIGMYICDVGVCSRLTHDEEIALATRIASGGPDGLVARNMLVRENLLLVINIAKRFTGRGVSLADLIEEGNLGLIKAAESFDPSTYGTRFSTHARYGIMKFLLLAVKNHGRNVRVPVYMYKLMRKWQKAASNLHSECGESPVNGDIVRRAGIPEAGKMTVQNILNALGHQEIQMGDADFSVFQEDDPALHAETKDLIERVRHLLKILDPRDAFVLEQRFGLNGSDRSHTLNEIGVELNMTREGVRLIEKRCLELLRNALE